MGGGIVERRAWERGSVENSWLSGFQVFKLSGRQAEG